MNSKNFYKIITKININNIKTLKKNDMLILNKKIYLLFVK